ncbi:type VII secretion protein EccB [Amycolatopsis xylanica]|uniref:Type VII secretion protein EccB n=2 Tax=Amycolatopsis xylanica TaxID=589385 RepID=A0A1H3LKA7_9PSEU|nr:type VII secretion protein EccB [Amycolatopsis xylanica]
MQSALVRRDAVMLNDPMRTHSRATVVGFFLGMIGMIGFVVWGLLSPAPSVPEAGKIVIGEQSGTVYVVMGNPKKLYPTFNMASARLLLMAQGGASGGKPSPATVVGDDQLRDVPRGRLTGIPDGPQLLPSASQRISNDWAVCDEIGIDRSLPGELSGKNETSVYAGVPKLGRELANNEALLAKSALGKTYLVYRLAGSVNQRNANTVRAEIDPKNSGPVNTALELGGTTPRFISEGMLNAIPEVPMLTKPFIEGADTAPPFAMNNLKIGDVFSTQPAGAPMEYWVITRTGIQHVSPVVANILRGSSNSIQSLGFDKIQNVKQLKPTDDGALQVQDYPQTKVAPLDPAKQSEVACLGWNITGEGNGRDVHTSVYVDNKLPAPKNDSIELGTPSADRGLVNRFYMKPGFAAAVRSVVIKEQFDRGPIQLVSDRGLRYGVPDVKTAEGLGLDNLQPAPEAILALLPSGASLNTQDVLATYDTVPIDKAAKNYPTARPSSAAAPPPGK